MERRYLWKIDKSNTHVEVVYILMLVVIAPEQSIATEERPRENRNKRNGKKVDYMIVNGYKYGISLLPENCIAYRDGYRYGAYKQNLQDKDDMHITEFFKTEKEVQKFVNHNKEYGRG